MNRIFLLLCIAFSAIAVTACANSNKTNNETMSSDNSKVIVTYFSATGNTRSVAQDLAKTLNADIREIVPEQRYTNADLNWQDSLSRSSVEMRDLNSRPAIVKDIENLDNYDVVFVGFPIWWYTAPTIINTFIESYDFNGKTIIPFATSGGSTIDKSCADLKAKYPELNFKPGKLLNSYDEESLKAWAEELGL
jgi:flavodoxin